MKIDVLVHEIPNEKDLNAGKHWRLDAPRRPDLDFQVEAESFADAEKKSRQQMLKDNNLCITRVWRNQCLQLYFQPKGIG